MTAAVDQLAPDHLVDGYERDGCAALRAVLSAEWIERMRAAIDRVLDRPGPAAHEMVDEGRFFNEYFLWLYDEDFRAFCLDSPLPELAARLMRSPSANLFGDQLLVKEPGTAAATDWHTDAPYLPFQGGNAIGFWAPFDTVTRENGRLAYLRGSHCWPKPKIDAAIERLDEAVEKGEPIASTTAGFEIAGWDLEPGDVLVHHPAIGHYASGNNTTDRRRRVLSVRYTGEGATYHPKPWSLTETPSIRRALPKDDLREGAPMGGRLYPRAWPR